MTESLLSVDAPPWIFTRVMQRIMSDRGLPRAAVDAVVPKICDDLAATHGQEAIACLLADIAISEIKDARPPGYDQVTGPEIDAWLAAKLTVGPTVRADSYEYQLLETDALRRRADPHPLCEVLRYWDGLGETPSAGDFGPEILRRFGGIIEPFHYLADLGDGDPDKFRFISGGPRQPIVRGFAGDPDLMRIANHPYRPLADEMAARLERVAAKRRPIYQIGRLYRHGDGVEYRILTLPLFDARGACRRAIVLIEDRIALGP